MLRHPVRALLTVAVLLFIPLLSACGGGDDGGGESKSSTSLSLVLSDTDIVLEGTVREVLDSVIVTISVRNIGEAPVYLSASHTGAAIESASINTSGTTARLYIRPASPYLVGVGSHTATIEVKACADQACKTQISGSPAKIDVSYMVTDKPEMSSSSLQFTYVLGSSEQPLPQSIEVKTVESDWQIESKPDWLTVSASKGSGATIVDVEVDPTRLAVGDHDAELIVTTGVGSPAEIAVTLSIVAPTISMGAETIVLGGDYHQDLSPKEVEFWLNTGSNSYPFTVSVDGDGAVLVTSASESVSETPSIFTLVPDKGVATGGTWKSSVKVAVDIGGHEVVRSVPVELRLASRQILVSDNGIGLANLPSRSKLTHEIEVRDSYRQDNIDWSASSNAAWLAVTPSGKTGSKLTLSANPAGLAVDTLHEAIVTVSSPSGLIDNVEVIRVALWNSATDSNEVDSLAAAYTEVVTDPLRPYAYLNAGGGDIDVYNIYTSSLVSTLKDIGVGLSDMTTSTDGSRLYAMDEGGLQIVVVNLDSMTVEDTWPFTSLGTQPIELEYTRMDGKETVAFVQSTVAFKLFDAFTGDPIDMTMYAGWPIAVSTDGSSMCAGSYYSCSRTYYSDYSDSVVAERIEWSSVQSGSNIRELAISPDGKHMFGAYGSPYVFVANNLDTASFWRTFPAEPYPSGVTVDADGRLMGSISTSLTFATDLWFYAMDGTLLKSHVLPGEVLHRQAAVAGDTLRAVAVTESSSSTDYVHFVDTR